MNIGITREEFIKNYFEQNFLFCHNALYPHKIDWNHINEVLFSSDPSDGMLSIFKDGLIPIEKYTENFIDFNIRKTRITKSLFNEYMRNGATLVINRIETKSSLINEITRRFGKFIGERTVANGYAAFGGEGTFSKHWDTHDVFAVQLIGQKRWKIFEPTFPLPLPHQRSKNFKHECPETPVFDRVLNEGDVLYIPRGWWHEAAPIKDRETFHIAVGVHTLHIVDYILWSCINTFSEIPALRKTIKHEDYSTNVIEKSIHFIKDILIKQDNLEEFKNHQISQERIPSEFNIQDTFKKKLSSQYLTRSIKFNSSLYSPHSKKIHANGIAISSDEISKSIFLQILNNPGDSIEKIIRNIDPNFQERALSLIKNLIENDIIYLD
ncbi:MULTISPECIES: JmjC domain-containing protein [unclassified Delftia]|uniref:JmjC domain-containing protein n=1 Tax=unclassified Delftia TaxID=2613839 RepID=UPI0009DF56B4|nr:MULTISPECIES: cupin domain-containing protein [unclassified Delftia]MDC2862435.1 cupin domain-containing protein [Delftia sp. DT-2]